MGGTGLWMGAPISNVVRDAVQAAAAAVHAAARVDSPHRSPKKAAMGEDIVSSAAGADKTVEKNPTEIAYTLAGYALDANHAKPLTPSPPHWGVSRPQPRAFCLESPGKGPVHLVDDGREELDADESLHLSSSASSATSQSSKSWSFPPYQGVTSPSLSAGLSPHHKSTISVHASDTARELAAILGPLQVAGSGGKMAASVSHPDSEGDASVRSSLKSLGELETGLELEIRKVTAAEEEEAQRALGAVIGSPEYGGVHRKENEISRSQKIDDRTEEDADRSLEEAWELQGLPSLRGSDDMIAARLREQHQHQRSLQQSLDQRLARLEHFADSAASSLPSSLPSSAPSHSAATSVRSSQGDREWTSAPKQHNGLKSEVQGGDSNWMVAPQLPSENAVALETVDVQSQVEAGVQDARRRDPLTGQRMGAQADVKPRVARGGIAWDPLLPLSPSAEALPGESLGHSAGRVREEGRDESGSDTFVLSGGETPMKSPGGEGGGRGTTTPARLHETRGGIAWEDPAVTVSSEGSKSSRRRSLGPPRRTPMPAFMVPEGGLDGSSTGRLEQHKGQDVGHSQGAEGAGEESPSWGVSQAETARRYEMLPEVKLLREAQRRRQQIVERRARALEMDAERRGRVVSTPLRHKGSRS